MSLQSSRDPLPRRAPRAALLAHVLTPLVLRRKTPDAPRLLPSGSTPGTPRNHSGPAVFELFVYPALALVLAEVVFNEERKLARR